MHWTHHNRRTEGIWIQSRTQRANHLPSSKIDWQVVQATESQIRNSKLNCTDRALISGTDSGFWWQSWSIKRWILLSLSTSRKTCINCFHTSGVSTVLYAPHLKIMTSSRLGPSESDTFSSEFWWSISFHPGDGFQEFLADDNFPD